MKHLLFSLLLTAGLLGYSGVFAEPEDPVDPGEGSLITFQKGDDRTELLNIPLLHTDVTAEISGFIVRVDVEQIFRNSISSVTSAIEAIYVFPLPENSAVDEMTMIVGKKTIKGIIKKRQEAESLYQQAKANGQTASLLTQERPNIFTQSVANILPGDEIKIRISYVQDLKYDHGGYEYNFPMVVGPRFIPGTPLNKTGGGWSDDTDRVPDASRITPPVIQPFQRSGQDISLKVYVDAGVPITNIRSPSHKIDLVRKTSSIFHAVLNSEDSIPNKDFILRFDTAGDELESAVLTHASEKGGFFSLILQPQTDVESNEITPKELIFVVDCSGSMMGAPIKQAKSAMKKCISGMNAEDFFQVIQFSNDANGFSPYPVPNTPDNVQRAIRFIDAMQGEGGTMMTTGIKAALDYPKDPNRIRMVLFMTDGYIGNETEIFSEIEKRLGSSRLFSFGVGTSVNHYLLDTMAKVGRGFVQYVRPDEDTTSAVNLFYERINNPLLTDISIDWGGLDVEDMSPVIIPDLFSAQPVIVHGRYGNSGSALIKIHGKIKGQPWEESLEVCFPLDQPEHDVLATLWARSRIEMLSSQMFHGEQPALVDEITKTALEFKIMSKYTAFVAVSEEIRRGKDDRIETVQVPVEMPEMVEYEGIFGKDCKEKSQAMGYCSDTDKAPCKPSAIPGRELKVVKTKEEEPQIRSIEIKIRMISGEFEEKEILLGFEPLESRLTEFMRRHSLSHLTLNLKRSMRSDVTIEPSTISLLSESAREELKDLLKILRIVPGGQGSAVIEITF